MYDVAVLHHVFFTFDGYLAGFAASGFRAVVNVVVVFDDFGANKSAFKIRMDCACGLRGFGAFDERPRSVFVLADGKKGL